MAAVSNYDNNMTKKTIITCAVTGAATQKADTPYLPITPGEIANSALEAARAGATVAHIHVRDPITGRPSMNLDYYKEVVDKIKTVNPDLIINLTTGPGSLMKIKSHAPSEIDDGTRMFSAADRVKHIEILKPDICTLDLNTMNLKSGALRINQIDISREMLKRVLAVGTKPEMELFSSGDVMFGLDLFNEGLITQKTALWQIVMGTHYGWPASTDTLQYATRQLPINSIWSAFGIGKSEMPMVAQTWILGGHVRVGLEDNIYISKGILAESNALLVEKAARIICDLGGSIANVNETRSILAL
jgi:uncharacterized protein (DUF849 family)